MNADDRPIRNAGDPRSAARLAAVQALYQMEMAETPLATVTREFIDHRLGMKLDGDEYAEADTSLFTSVVEGVVEHQARIDEEIALSLSQAWTLARLERLLRALLRAGAFELLFRGDTPPAAVINEYVDVAHAFFADNEPALVNGVLSAISVRTSADGKAT